jgi:hypothetical protein
MIPIIFQNHIRILFFKGNIFDPCMLKSTHGMIAAFPPDPFFTEGLAIG